MYALLTRLIRGNARMQGSFAPRWVVVNQGVAHEGMSLPPLHRGVHCGSVGGCSGLRVETAEQWTRYEWQCGVWWGY